MAAADLARQLRACDERSAEDLLRESEERHRLILETANEAFVMIDSNGDIAGWNREAERTFGWSRDEVEGRGLADIIIPPAYRDAHRRGLERFLQSGAGPVLNKRIELSALRRDGEEFPIELTIAPMQSAGGVFFIAFLHDISDRRRAEEDLRRATSELERSNAELEQFAYVASHDLQEPLRAITGCVQLLQQRLGNRLEGVEHDLIRHAVDGAARMRSLILDLLAYSRVGTRGRPFEPADCERLFEHVLAGLAPAIQESGALITHDPLPTVMGDASQIGQLLQNLIGNAIKYCDDSPPRVHVSAVPREGTWRFSVQDSGIGIEPQYFERIFLIFQRLHTRREYSGTGIGLAICKKIVERHGGRIWVESEPGKGSTFFFTVLAANETEAARPE